MNYQTLIAASKAHLGRISVEASLPSSGQLFPVGAKWMYDRLQELDTRNELVFDPAIDYTFYGRLKYGICLTGFAGATMWLSEYALWLTPISVLVFYLLEAPFIFLFPLLIDHVRHPLSRGFKVMYRLGPIRCLLTVIPIAFFMVTGLLRKKDRLGHWYIGCLAIVIWYQYEVRDRI